MKIWSNTDMKTMLYDYLDVQAFSERLAV